MSISELLERRPPAAVLGGPYAPPARAPHGAQIGRLAIVVAVGLAIWLLPAPAGIEPRAWQLLAIFVATIVGIIAKPLPIGAVGMLAMATLLGTRTLTLTESLTGFSNSSLWLIISAFFIAEGFSKTGLGQRIAYGLVSVFGQRTLGLGYSLVATDFVLAPAIASNTARAGGVIFPILKSISAAAIERDPVAGKKTSAFLTLAAYQSTCITSAMFLTAMVANPLATQLAAAQGVYITWIMWALAASVPGLLSLLIMPMLVYRLCPPGENRSADAPGLARTALAQLGPMRRAEKLMATISGLLLAAWIFGPLIKLDATAAALIAIAALLVTGVLAWDDILGQREAWNTFVWFAALLTMAAFLGQLGIIKWLSTNVGNTFSGTPWTVGFIGLTVTYFYLHYFFASNTAHVGAMYAAFLGVAIALGTPPQLAALVLGFSSNLFACTTHYGTGPGPILFGMGTVSLGTWWKTGLAMSVVYLVLWLGVGAFWWRVLGLWH